MSFSKFFAWLVAQVGAGAVFFRHRNDGPLPQAAGAAPRIPHAKPQGIPTLKMPTAKGWTGDQKPVAAKGLAVNLFAGGFKHPRWIEVLPNGDVLVADALPGARKSSSLFDYAMTATMKRAAALADESANRIMLLRDANGDGKAEISHIYRDHLNLPFGMAVVGDRFYVGNTDGLVSFAYEPGATELKGEGVKLASFKPGGHWTRSLLVSPDRKRIYVGVGSLSNIGDNGMEAEEGRACIYEHDIESGETRIFAGGLRNPVGLAWEPNTGALWTVVNERDGLGDETPPDYLTSVQDGGFYGWPYSYWNRVVDDRVPQNPELVARQIQPDYALGGHTASLGLCWMPAGTLPGFGDGMVIGQHGSWNRSKLSGYRLTFVPFENGKPSGPMRDILTGFLSPDEKASYGRPVGVVIGPDRKSLLMADDVGNVIWRVAGA
ncbi:sorbosone dehydrogenase family protein [Salmonella enterica subsp. enterica]|nr:sorbosone dehydrogenase family protein [Salmonella enterica subsp. enterica]